MYNLEEQQVEQQQVISEQENVDFEDKIQQEADKPNQQNEQLNQQNQQYHQSKKHKYLKCNYKYCKNYEDINQIVKSFKSLSSLLVPLEIENISNALCYVIRSNNDDDVHKAIKYGVWTSVPGNNLKLSAAWEKAQQLNIDVYLFFSVVKSGQFIGVSKLKSSFQEETFSYWWQPHKFKGHFKIEWVFVKDVKQKAFEGLKNCQNDDISRSKDCTELNFETTGKKMLEIYKDSNSSTSIFQDFIFLDQKEQVLRNTYSFFGNQGNNNSNYKRNQPQNSSLFQNYFMNPQMMAQGGMLTQYTQEQINQISQMCFTNIYPPNTYAQINNQFMMGNSNNQGGQTHKNHHHHNNKRNFNSQKKVSQNKDHQNNQQKNQSQAEEQKI